MEQPLQTRTATGDDHRCTNSLVVSQSPFKHHDTQKEKVRRERHVSEKEKVRYDTQKEKVHGLQWMLYH
jgi:hypothetical protein